MINGQTKIDLSSTKMIKHFLFRNSNYLYNHVMSKNYPKNNLQDKIYLKVPFCIIIHKTLECAIHLRIEDSLDQFLLQKSPQENNVLSYLSSIDNSKSVPTLKANFSSFLLEKFHLQGSIKLAFYFLKPSWLFTQLWRAPTTNIRSLTTDRRQSFPSCQHLLFTRTSERISA